MSELGKSKMDYNSISTRIDDLKAENRDLRQKCGMDDDRFGLIDLTEIKANQKLE